MSKQRLIKRRYENEKSERSSVHRKSNQKVQRETRRRVLPTLPMKEVRKMRGRERKVHYRERETYSNIIEDSIRSRVMNIR